MVKRIRAKAKKTETATAVIVPRTLEEWQALAVELVDKWQSRLYLQDWTATIEVRREEDMPESVDGQVTFAIYHKTCEIIFLDPTVYGCEILDAEGYFEWVIVHELIHLHFAPFSYAGNENMGDVLEEWAVNALTENIAGPRPVEREK